MKKLMLCALLSGIFFITACDEENESSGPDPFIGTWYLNEVKENGVSEIPDFCEIKSRYIVEGNTFVYDEYFFTNEINCVNDGDTGTWVNQGNNTYEVRYDNDDADEEPSYIRFLFEDGKLIEDYNGFFQYIYSSTPLTSGSPVCAECEDVLDLAAPIYDYCYSGAGTYTASANGEAPQTLELPDGVSFAEFIKSLEAGTNIICLVE